MQVGALGIIAGVSLVGILTGQCNLYAGGMGILGWIARGVLRIK